jgi:putative adenylate-forming enzyme
MADRAERGEMPPPGALSAGWSTGGNGTPRGLFLASEAERAEYIGQSFARLLPPRALFHRQRIALHLRAGNALYSDVGRRRIAFRHLPLATPLTDTVAALESFAPTIFIAPPHRLLSLAEAGVRLPTLRYLFCGSEPISMTERDFVADRLRLTPRAIYQAAEGFLGAECPAGRLHLNDHVLAVELEPVAGTPGFRPIITDLKRASQPVVRVRGDDYLELDACPCYCGFAGRVIRPVEGRITDLWPGAAGIVAPPQIVAAVESVLGAGWRWQAVGGTPRAILRVAPGCPPAVAEAAARSLAACAERPVDLGHDLAPWSGSKRRKVVWGGA